MFVRAYLRALTKEKDAIPPKPMLEAFAGERSLKISTFYVENESGALLKRPKLFELIEDAHEADILLIEQVDRLSRLDETDWNKLKLALAAKRIKVVALDLPTSWAMTNITTDETTNRLFESINSMLLDMLAAITRKEDITLRERAAQGVQKAKADAKEGIFPANRRVTAALPASPA